MKQTILFFALGLLAVTLTSGCNKDQDTSSTTSQAATNSMATNAPATTNQ